jgi:hypothetical protein
MPERMQLRNVPITSVEEGSAELDLEAEWIYKHAFSKASISNQVITTLILLHARQFLKSLLKP